MNSRNFPVPQMAQLFRHRHRSTFGTRRRNCGACPSTKFQAGCWWFGRHAIPHGPATP